MKPQIKGGHHDTENSFNCNSISESDKLYDQMKNVFLDINLWDGLFKKGTEFFLTDSKGKYKSGFAEKGDFIAIKIPGPKNKIGKGFDWTVIRELTITENLHQRKIFMEVQPCKHPNGSDKIAHFFLDAASNYFIIQKEGNKITSEVHGRNEIPNYKNLTLLQKFRNFFVATGGIFGMSKIQWEIWSKNILDEKHLQKCLQSKKKPH